MPRRCITKNRSRKYAVVDSKFFMIEYGSSAFILFFLLQFLGPKINTYYLSYYVINMFLELKMIHHQQCKVFFLKLIKIVYVLGNVVLFIIYEVRSKKNILTLLGSTAPVVLSTILQDLSYFGARGSSTSISELGKNLAILYICSIGNVWRTNFEILTSFR